MMAGIDRLKVRNFRTLSSIDLDLGPVSVFFGPNSAGKSTLLDVLWFLRDLGTRGLQQAVRFRSLGKQLLFSNGSEGNTESLSITIELQDAYYSVDVHWDGDQLVLGPNERCDIGGIEPSTAFMRAGTGKVASVDFHFDEQGNLDVNQPRHFRLPEPDRLGLPFVASQAGVPDSVSALNDLISSIRFFSSRNVTLKSLQVRGSPTDGKDDQLSEDCGNLWSILRQLHDRQRIDSRYATIDRFMSRAFPRYAGMAFEQRTPMEVSALFLEKDRRDPLRATATPDGYLQMLLVLTLLFGNPQVQPSLVLLDEPDLSLHPWALFVLTEAIELATKEWKRQVLIATHSPVLISQFSEDQLFLLMPGGSGTTVQRVSEMTENRDLLDQYTAGALYMSQLIGEQSSEPMVSVVPIDE